MLTPKRRHRRTTDDRQLDLTFVPGGIRRDGPGKFDTIIDGYVHGLTLDGCAEQAGDVSYGGHYSAVDLGPEALRSLHKEASEAGDRLTTEEEQLIAGSAGAIVREDGQGFVDVTYYDEEEEYRKAWGKVEDACAAYEEDEG